MACVRDRLKMPWRWPTWPIILKKKETSMSNVMPSGLFQVLVVGQGKETNETSLTDLKKRLNSTTFDRKAIFKLSADHPVALKENVSYDIAQLFIKTLKIIGVNCWVEPMPEDSPEAQVRQSRVSQ